MVGENKSVLFVGLAFALFVGIVFVSVPVGNSPPYRNDSADIRRRLNCVYHNWNHKTVCNKNGGGTPPKNGIVKLKGGAGDNAVRNGNNNAGTPGPDATTKPLPPTPRPQHSQGPVRRCGGSVQFGGKGSMEVINSLGSLTTVLDGHQGVNVPVHSLSFLGESCNGTTHEYSNAEYPRLQLLGRGISWTADLSKVGCRCIATVYLVPMADNKQRGSMGNFYCDANGIGGVNCAELDMEESNRHAFHSVLHTSHDTDGKNGGYGGGEWSWNGPRDWDKGRYGPGASCVNTLHPFTVHVSFPTNEQGTLSHLKTRLSQNGCTVESRNIGAAGGRHSYTPAAMLELTEVLKLGVTPVVSHFSPSKISWLVGVGKDKAGPCDANMVKSAVCGDAQFSDFRLHQEPE